jgi:hypothetical protein
MTTLMTAERLESIENDALEVLAGKKRDGLAFTGIEILTFIATQVVLPIVTGIVSTVMYEKWKEGRTLGQPMNPAQMRKQLEGMPVSLPDGAAPAILIEDATKILVAEGLGEEKARQSVEKIYQCVLNRIQ